MTSTLDTEPLQDGSVDRSRRPGTWVVGIDGSPHGERALEWAVMHGPHRASTIELLTAWQVPIYGPYPIDGALALPYDDRALADSARQSVDDLAERTRRRLDVPIGDDKPADGAATSAPGDSKPIEADNEHS